MHGYHAAPFFYAHNWAHTVISIFTPCQYTHPINLQRQCDVLHQRMEMAAVKIWLEKTRHRCGARNGHQPLSRQRGRSQPVELQTHDGCKQAKVQSSVCRRHQPTFLLYTCREPYWLPRNLWCTLIINYCAVLSDINIIIIGKKVRQLRLSSHISL